MSFDPASPFEVLIEFDSSKPFEVLSEFDPKKPFEIVDEVLKNLKVKTIDKPIVIPKKLSIISKSYTESQKKEIPALTTGEIISIVREEIKQIPNPKVIEKVVEKQIIKEIKKEEKKGDKIYAEEKTVEELKKQIEEFKSKVEQFLLFSSMGGSGVIGIPNPEGQNSKVLTVVKNQAVWGEASSNGGASANPFYIGDPNVNGSWRFFDDGTNLLIQRREAGNWVEKASFLS